MLKKLSVMVLLLLFFTAVQGWSMTQSGPTRQTPASGTDTTPAAPAKTKGTTQTTATQPGKATVSGATRSSGAGQTKTPSSESTRATTAASTFTVESIILDKIDQSVIYSVDGRTFPLSSSTRIIRNIQDSKMRVAELMFRNGVLVTVVIR